jgi:protein involved in polysaccharide export with SLBB domain
VLPILGPVPLSGKTVKEAEEVIREILARDYLVNPRVQIKLLSEVWPSAPAVLDVSSAPSADRVTAAGPSSDLLITNQVARPGKYPWSGEGLTLRRAIELAGGATARGDLTRVKVRRLIGGERRELEVNLAQPDEPRRGGALLLKPGDEVEVPARR